MVARTTGRVSPAPGPTPFTDAALDLYDRGLAPIPLGGEDGKRPLVPWGKLKYRYGRATTEAFMRQFPTANVGILTLLSNVTPVDVDDPELEDVMADRCGYTPLITATPSGGTHRWYRFNGERRQLHLDGLKVDVPYVLAVPPSVRPSGPHAGKAYTFKLGSWDDLPNLPTMKTAPSTVTSLRPVLDGDRHRSLFNTCMDQAPACDTFEALLDVARTINAAYEPPVEDTDVVSTAASVWGYETRGENWRGRRARVVVTEQVIDRLVAVDRRRAGDALLLYTKLRASHGPRKMFAIAARAMERDKTVPWSEKYTRTLTTVLEDADLVEQVEHGGNGPGDASQYQFCSSTKP